MKLNLIAVLIAFLSSTSLFAQDKILLKNGDLITAKVIEINSDFVKYKINNDGQEVVISVSFDQVESITYSNGTTESLSKFNNEIADYSKRHLIEYNFFDLILRNISLQYEFFPTKERDLSLILPVRIGIPPTGSNHYSYHNKLEIGLGVLFYPFKGKMLNYFTGFELAYQLKESLQLYNNYPYYSSQKIQRNYGALYITNGIRLNFKKKFGLGYSFSVGFNMREGSYSTDIIAKGMTSLFFRL